MSTTRPERRASRGFAIVSAIFILVALAALAVAIAVITTRANTAQALDVIGSRAFQAARAGLDWAAYQVLDPANATATAGTAPLPNCPGVALAAACPTAAAPATAAFPGGGFAGSVLAGIGVSVSCHCADFVEAARNIRVYQLRATATIGAGQTAVERQVQARVAYCRDPAGSAATQPPYGCL